VARARNIRKKRVAQSCSRAQGGHTGTRMGVKGRWHGHGKSLLRYIYIYIFLQALCESFLRSFRDVPMLGIVFGL